MHRDIYRVRKIWRALLRRGEVTGRDQVTRLMHMSRLRGATRARRPRRGPAVVPAKAIEMEYFQNQGLPRQAA